MPNLDSLFSPLRLGAMTLPNRIVMPPMTQMRSSNGVPTSRHEDA
jgi:N-ethylmaleimide reductase